MESPIGWARNGEASVAYRTLGAGPLDIVFVSGLISHLEALFDEPGVQRWFDRLGRLGRVILLDRRGSGLSDPIPDACTVADEVDDDEITWTLSASGRPRR